MMRMQSTHPLMRSTALLVAGAMTLPMLLAGCGGQSSPPPPPVDDTRGGQVAPPPPGRAPVAQKQGMSTTKKVMILAGAAALYYMYRKHQQRAKAQGQDIQYYRSKDGRIYYRDQEHRAHYVTAPAPMSVPTDEAQQYSDIQGYNNQNSGRGLDQLFPAG